MTALKPALDGIRVIELGSMVAVPWGASMLGDMGADVIKTAPWHRVIITSRHSV